MITLDNTGRAKSLTDGGYIPKSKALQDRELVYGLVSAAVADPGKSETSNIGASSVFYCKD